MSNFSLILNPPLNPVAFRIFGYPVRFYGIMIAIALITGYYLISKFIEKKFSKKEADIFTDYSIILIICALIGARAFYVLGSLEYYFSHPNEIIMINHGGISIWGAILFGISGLIVLSKIYKFDFFVHCGVIAVFMPLCQAIGRWGNFFNQEAFGYPTDFIIKMFISAPHRPEQFKEISYFHPTFLYESILDLIIFIVLLSTFNKNNPAKTVFLYIILYSLARLIVESFRIDSILNISKIPIASIISILMLFVGITGLIFVLKKPQKGA